jgi:Tfp pilus assembly protein PilV
MNNKQHQRSKYLRSVFRSKSQNHKITKSQNSFTLVEITMAMGIIAIGMVGVMALLPIGFNATRDAMGDNYSSDMADQFLHYTAIQCKMPNPAAGDPWDWTDPTHFLKKLPTMNSARINTTTYKGDSTITTDETSVAIDWDNPDLMNICQGATSPTTGTYGIIQQSGTITDFKAIVRIWQSAIKYYDSSGTPTYLTDNGTTAGQIQYGVRLNCEISWPPEKPYSMREKRKYILEIFNKNK